MEDDVLRTDSQGQDGYVHESQLDVLARLSSEKQGSWADDLVRPGNFCSLKPSLSRRAGASGTRLIHFVFLSAESAFALRA